MLYKTEEQFNKACLDAHNDAYGEMTKLINTLQNNFDLGYCKDCDVSLDRKQEIANKIINGEYG
jgi:hypothetical protein